MSIQRYGFDSFGPGHPGGVIIFDPKGSYVLHADHLAAVDAAYARGREDEREAAAQRVEALCVAEHHNLCECMTDALAAIRGE